MSAELFVEIRCEELPPSMVLPALNGLRDGLLKRLEGIEHGRVRTFATPRRLAVAVDDVATERASVEKLVTGPPADRAFDADGKPTPAAIGFAKGKGLDASALEVVDTPKGRVVAVKVREGGERTDAIVASGLEEIVRGLPFHKSMEWGSGGIRFGRPIQGVAGLLGGRPLGGTVAGHEVGASSMGQRFAPETAFTFDGAEDWLTKLRDRWVEPDLGDRRERIRLILADAARELGADAIVDDDLLEQVLHLVEWPTKVIGTFEADLLELPPRLLVESMKVHQRYFAVHVDGKLTNRFVVISNNPVGDPELVAAGNARVLRARFHDAKFFFAEDKKKRLEEHGEGLGRMRWIKGLGTMAQKQARVAILARELAGLVGADPDRAEHAGELCKADLLTAMVNEFPELQGHMGKLYALAQGEDERVASAIEEHYHPRFAGDAVAWTPDGVALALADRLDTLVGCFGIGLVPKGGGDPQGLRRAAIGLVNTLIGHELFVDVRELFASAVERFHAAVRANPDGFQGWVKERGTADRARDEDGLVDALVEFALARFKAQAVADGTSADLVDAVLIGGESRPLVLQRKVEALRSLAKTEDFAPVMQTFKRVLNISRGVEGREGPLTEPSEQALAEAIAGAEGRVREAAAAADYARALDEMLALKGPVAKFFDDVLVDSPDPAVKAARIALLQRIGATFLQVADFSRISTR